MRTNSLSTRRISISGGNLEQLATEFCACQPERFTRSERAWNPSRAPAADGLRVYPSWSGADSGANVLLVQWQLYAEHAARRQSGSLPEPDSHTAVVHRHSR